MTQNRIERRLRNNWKFTLGIVVLIFIHLFVGLLLNSMAAANQEITPELQALAMKDPRFSKGQTRSKGGKGNPGGGKRRVRMSSPCLPRKKGRKRL